MSPNPLGGRVDQLAQAVAERVVNLVLDAIDMDEILNRIDINALVARVDMDEIVAKVDIDSLVARVDVNRVVEQVDVDGVIARVDVGAVVDNVDVDALVARVDVDALVARVDVNAMVSRVDVDGIVSSLDIDALMEQTELGGIIARSTSGVLSQVLDVIRAQGVGLDDFFARWTNRILRRKPDQLPTGPALLQGRTDRPAAGTARVARSGGAGSVDGGAERQHPSVAS